MDVIELFIADGTENRNLLKVPQGFIFLVFIVEQKMTMKTWE